MSTSTFPAAADNDTNLIRRVTGDVMVLADHNNLVDAIEAIEDTLLSAGLPTTEFLRGDMTWHVPSGGGGSGAMTLITNIVLGADTPTFDFTGIVGTYNHLHLVVMGRGTDASEATPQVQLNADSGAHYYSGYLRNLASSADGAYAAVATVGNLGDGVPGSADAAGNVSIMVVDIPFYALTTFNKVVKSVGARWNSTGNAINSDNTVLWAQAAAITEVKLLLSAGNWKAGSAASLYGIS